MKRTKRIKKENREDIEFYIKVGAFAILLIKFLRDTF